MKYSYIAGAALKHLRSGFKLPYMVMFETTLMCNMFCEYCIFGVEGKFNDLKSRAVRDRIFKRIDEMCDLGVFALSFSGGEPLSGLAWPDVDGMADINLCAKANIQSV